MPFDDMPGQSPVGEVPTSVRIVPEDRHLVERVDHRLQRPGEPSLPCSLLSLVMTGGSGNREVATRATFAHGQNERTSGRDPVVDDGPALCITMRSRAPWRFAPGRWGPRGTVDRKHVVDCALLRENVRFLSGRRS